MASAYNWNEWAARSAEALAAVDALPPTHPDRQRLARRASTLNDAMWQMDPAMWEAVTATWPRHWRNRRVYRQ